MIGLLLWHSYFLFANTLLVLGDSLSAGYGLPVKQGWVSLLKEKLEAQGYHYQVVNASISGDTTGNGLARLPALLKKNQPSIVIVILGGNDGLRGFDIGMTKNNLEKIIQLCKQAKAKILLVGVTVLPNYGSKYKNKFMAVYTELTTKYTLPLVPNLFSSIKGNVNLLQDDGVHLTAQAQPLLLNLIWPKLVLLLQK